MRALQARGTLPSLAEVRACISELGMFELNLKKEGAQAENWRQREMTPGT